MTGSGKGGDLPLPLKADAAGRRAEESRESVGAGRLASGRAWSVHPPAPRIAVIGALTDCGLLLDDVSPDPEAIEHNLWVRYERREA